MRDLDLDLGMDPSIDEITPSTPGAPGHREGAALFVWDDAERFGVPRIGVEAVGATWDTARGFQVTIQQPDGRMLAVSSSAAPHGVHDASGRPRVFGAGPVRLECVEPFRHWRVELDGELVDTSVEAVLRSGPPTGAGAAAFAAAGGRAVSVRLLVDARMVAPPWVLGTRDPDGAFPPVGEHRFEQLFVATGTLSIEDGDERAFSGGGLRIHRKGANRGAGGDFYGHCWQTGSLPSGRAYGFMHYHPRPDGSVKYHEGWIRDGDRTVPAKVVDTPWMHDFTDQGEDVSFTLRSARGDVRIEAETFVSWFKPGRPGGFPTWQAGITRCRWDGEPGHGMIERTPIS